MEEMSGQKMALLDQRNLARADATHPTYGYFVLDVEDLRSVLRNGPVGTRARVALQVLACKALKAEGLGIEEIADILNHSPKQVEQWSSTEVFNGRETADAIEREYRARLEALEPDYDPAKRRVRIPLGAAYAARSRDAYKDL